MKLSSSSVLSEEFKLDVWDSCGNYTTGSPLVLPMKSIFELPDRYSKIYLQHPLQTPIVLSNFLPEMVAHLSSHVD
jgi:hypothetical protein